MLKTPLMLLISFRCGSGWNFSVPCSKETLLSCRQAGREAGKTLGPHSQNGCTGYKEGNDHSVRFSLVLEGEHERHAAFVCKLEVHFSILGADCGAHAVYV